MHNGNNKEIQDDLWIYGSNISCIKHFNGKEIPNSVQELKEIYGQFHLKN